jgi:hypothetical protein
MKNLNVVSFISFLLLISILTGCSQAAIQATSTIMPEPPTIVPTSTIVPPTATFTLTETITPLPSATPTITASPTPSIPTSCSDKEKMDEVVSAFLATTKFTTYEDYIASLEPVRTNSLDVRGVTYTSFAYNNINIPVYLLGSFEISLKKFPPAEDTDKGICLLYANPDFPRPISVLGAGEFNGQFIVASTTLSRKPNFYPVTGFMSEKKFYDWINSQIGKISKIGLILNFYDSSYFEKYKNENLEEDLSLMPNQFTNMIRHGYPEKEKRPFENFKDNYKHGQEVILDILSKYGTLFINEFDFALIKVSDFNISKQTPVSIDETSRHIIYDDNFKDNVDLYLDDKSKKDLCKKTSAYSGDCGISLIQQGNFLHFAVDFVDSPIKASDYDYVEFYQRTSTQIFNFMVFGRYTNHDWEDRHGYIIRRQDQNIDSYNRWLGLLNSVTDEKKQSWILVRIPISNLSRNIAGNIWGISFAYFAHIGEINIDDISLVKELKP